MFRKTIYSDIVTIDCPKERVWQVLLDLENYPKWNPFTNPVISTLEIGAPVELHVHMPVRGDRVSTEIVLCKDSNESLSWGMTMLHPIFLKARRDQKLIALDSKRCTYQTWDAFSGCLTPLVVGLFGEDMQNGFNGVARSLKAFCEEHPE
jgi:hypothetical protein